MSFLNEQAAALDQKNLKEANAFLAYESAVAAATAALNTALAETFTGYDTEVAAAEEKNRRAIEAETAEATTPDSSKKPRKKG